jgi:hypothetical protein
MGIDVFITIDVECGDFSKDFEGSVFGRLKNYKNQEFGLRYILNTLSKYNLRGTFFIETFVSLRLGLEGLKRACQLIKSYNQEIQLHIHPNFMESSSQLGLETENVSSLLSDYSLNDQIKMINFGKEILYASGVENVEAFRSGGFGANNVTLKALEACGMLIDSSYNLSYLKDSCGFEIKPYLTEACFVDGICEVPITVFMAKGFSFLGIKHLQIGAVSISEIRSVLTEAEKMTLKTVCILLHSNEFICYGDKERSFGIPNRINMDRFDKCCRSLSNNNLFRTQRLTDVLMQCNDNDTTSPKDPRLLTVSIVSWTDRMIQQLWKRIYCKFKGCRPLG